MWRHTIEAKSETFFSDFVLLDLYCWEFIIYGLFSFRRDYNEFLDDLEEDAELRQNVNIFKDRSKDIPVDINDGIDPSEPRITLEEMLDDLVLDDDDMGEELWTTRI